MRIPQVVGYIIIGILIGQSGLRIVGSDVVEALRPFNYFALGLIGFMVGGELRKEVFVKYGKQLITILLCEGITPFIMVTLAVGFVGTWLFGPKAFVWPLAFLLGAVASATDPASTTSVLKEYKTRGPLTTNVMGIVALDDGLALFLFAVSSSVAGSLLGKGGGIFRAIFHPFYEIIGAVGIGVLSGLILNKMLLKYAERERILAFSIGTVLLVTGISLALHASLLLAVMTLGIVVVNFRPYKSREVFEIVEGFTPPIYVLFFVLVGAKLKFSYMTLPILALIATYLFYGLTGKMAGAKFGARISGAPGRVVKHLPYALFSQAGVAIGLSILAAQHFPGEVGGTLVIIVTATTFFTQLIGPPFTKLAVTKAGETGLNITEEDIIKETKARDVMDKNPPLIYENMRLADILHIFSENDSLFYPVINKNRELRGLITVEGIRQTFLESDVNELILAHDLMEPLITKIAPDIPLAEVKEELERYDIEYLPVVDPENRIKGSIEKKKLNKFISTRIIALQEQAESLDKT